MIIEISFHGHREAHRRVVRIGRDLRGKKKQRAMRQATRIVYRTARKYAPVHLGTLKASINQRVEVGPWNKTVGFVGSDLPRAPFSEYPTRPHWPPPGALTVWATDHGTTDYSVRRSISISGTSRRAIPITGSQGFFYLHRAIEDNEKKIVRHIGSFVYETINRYP